MSVGDRIKTRRKSLGLTLQELGDKVGVGASTVRKWENGIIKNIKMDKAEKLASSLGVTVDYILGLVDNSVKVGTIELYNGVVGQHSGDFNVGQKLTKEEIELLRIFNSLNVKNRMKLLTIAMEMEENE